MTSNDKETSVILFDGSAIPKRKASDEHKNDNRRRGPSQQTKLMAIAEACELWHCPDRNAYATIEVNGHYENWGIRSPSFKRWLSGQFYMEYAGAVGAQVLEDVLRVLEAMAINDGQCHTLFRRIGEMDGDLYLDLADEAWRSVVISKEGWTVIDRSPVKFLRSAGMRALPAPEAGTDVEDLRRFINVGSDVDFVLIVSWLVGAFRARGPFPVLIVNGEQGSAKSTCCRLLRSLNDPNAAPIRAAPKDERDIVIAAHNSWVVALDNMSSVPNNLSDAICRLSTGGGFGTRALHTDRDEIIFEAQRPILLNGIPDLASRPDLGDRAISVSLPAIPEAERRSEEELWMQFEEACPGILGALLEAVSSALRNWPNTELDRLPRMADFARWVTAAEPGLGWERGTFLNAYEVSKENVTESAIEANPVAGVIRSLVKSEILDNWRGTSTELLEILNANVTEAIRGSRIWPRNASSLGTAITRIAPILRSVGINVSKHKGGADSKRTILIETKL